MADRRHFEFARRSAAACRSSCFASASTHRSTTLRTAARAHSLSLACEVSMAKIFALSSLSTPLNKVSGG